MAAKKAKTKRRITKPPSAKQLAARAKFVKMVRAKTAKKKSMKTARKCNKTIITKPKRVIVLNPRNSDISAKLKRMGFEDGDGISFVIRSQAGRGPETNYTGIVSEDASGKLSIYTGGNKLQREPISITPKRKNPAKSTRRKYRNGSYTVEARPKYASTVKETVNALTRGSAIRKVRRTVPGPKNVYTYRVEKNPVGKVVRRKVRNGYMDMVIAGHATQVQQGGRTGWTVRGGGTKSRRKGAGFFPVGKGIVPVSRSGYYLDKATGTVFSKKVRNVAKGWYYGGSFHPARESADYDAARTGETGKKPIRTRSKKKKAAVQKAIRTSTDKAETRKRKTTTSRLASRSLSRSVSLKAGSRTKNPLRIYTVTAIPLETGKREKLGDYEATSPTKAVSLAKKDAAELGSRFKAKAYQSKINTVATRQFYARFARKPALKAASRRNPSPAENRREFAGKYSGERKLYFPDGTPAGLSKLGKLVLLKTEAGTIKPAQKNPAREIWLCRDQKGKLHLGSTSQGPLYSGPAGSLGEVSRLEYQEAKPHLGYKNPVVWFHKMGEETGERPTLHSDGKGGLKFRGGKYSIESRGIVN